MEDNLARTWLWMYFSGLSVDEIASEYSCSKARVFVSLKTNIEKYNLFFREEREKEKAAAVSSTPLKESKERQIISKQKEIKKTIAEGKQLSKPAIYRPKKQAQRIYTKIRKRIEAQFDKKFYIGDMKRQNRQTTDLFSMIKHQVALGTLGEWRIR